ncbi:MAG: AEC family transporter [Theionarchaea archaeon]|nr:AEC family transporter [Theionarchaea archaeon]
MTIIETVLPSFIVIGLAFVLQKKRKLDLGPLIDTALYLASPCLIFGSLVAKTYSIGELLPVALSAFLVILSALVVSWLVFSALRLDDKESRTIPVVLINAGNLGIPISLFAFGEESLGIVVMFFVGSAIMTYTLGIFLAARSCENAYRPWIEVFKLPLVYATLAGIAVSLLDIEIPLVVGRAVNLLGQSAIPLFLISLGMSLASINPRRDLPSAFLSASMRIGLGLALGILVATGLGLEGTARSVVILQSSMPPAVASFMLSKKYGCRPDLVAATVFVGTVMSIVTISLVLGFLI